MQNNAADIVLYSWDIFRTVQNTVENTYVKTEMVPNIHIVYLKMVWSPY